MWTCICEFVYSCKYIKSEFIIFNILFYLLLNYTINKFILQIFFKDRVVEEEGYILFIRENALQILLPRFGLECTLYLSSLNKENDAVSFEYDEKVRT